MADQQHDSDMRAAFAGLVAGVIALLVILGTISRLTSAMYAHEKPEQPAAAQPH